MDYQIIVDSCGRIPKEYQDEHYSEVPLTLLFDNEEITDYENLSQEEVLKKMEENKSGVKTACPSPSAYLNKIGNALRVYIVTLSSKLSGSFNSANIAKKMYEEEHKTNTQIDVIDSKAAASGQILIALKIKELESLKLDYKTIVAKINEYIEEMHTYFVLENMDNLRKNGRLSNIKAKVASMLNIKPIMGSTPEGSIQQLGQQRGTKKALTAMVERLVKETDNLSEKVVAIIHVNNLPYAEYVRDLIKSMSNVKDVVITNASGLATVYAENGGIVVAC